MSNAEPPTDLILHERQGAVLHLSLNRPTVGNALDIPLALALMQAVIAASEDDSVRCVLLSAQGRFFCTGGDIAAFRAAGEGLPTFVREITAYLHAAIACLTTMDKPVVVAVNGAAAGAGVGLALAADIVLAAESARFSMAYSSLGLSPDGGATWLLPRLVGLRQAQLLCLTSRRITADEAARIGMLTQVVADAQLMDEAWNSARQLAAGASQALGATKRLLRDSFANSLEAQMDQESRAIAGLSRTADAAEGIAAFAEKRPAHFSGKWPG